MNRLLAAMAVMATLAIVNSESKANNGMVFNLTQTMTVVDCNSDSNVASTVKRGGYVIYESNVAPLVKIYYIYTYTRKDATGVTRKYYDTPDPMLFEIIRSTIGTKAMWVLTYDDANTHTMFTGPEKTLKALGQKVSFPTVFSGYYILEDTEDGTNEIASGQATLKFNATLTAYGFVQGISASQMRTYLVEQLEHKGYIEDN